MAGTSTLKKGVYQALEVAIEVSKSEQADFVTVL